MFNIIKLLPSLHDKVWGGTLLREEFGMEIPSDTTGEAWVISAHPNGQSIVDFPNEYKGWTLDDLYQKHREYFESSSKINTSTKKFPLLVKFLDAKGRLSVQVHPDDDYALEHASELGKTECWYVISAKPGSEIVLGHNARNQEEFEQWVSTGKWDKLLRRIPVKAGDFYYVAAGTIHGIGEGVCILEIQQNSDTTYRVYDYERLDSEGNLRELHLADAFAVTTIPDQNIQSQKHAVSILGGEVTQLIESEYFTVWKLQCCQTARFSLNPMEFYLLTVIEGEGEIQVKETTLSLKKGEAFIIPVGHREFDVTGQLEMIISKSND